MAATGNERAVDPTTGALGDEDRIVRFHPARALGLLKAGRAAGLLAERTRDPAEDVGVRGAARTSLCMIGGAEAADALDDVAGRGGVGNMRLTATLGLGKLGDARAVEPLLGVVRNRRNSPGDRVSAIQSLAALGDGRAESVLSMAAKDSNMQVSDAAAVGLKQLRQTARHGLMAAANSPRTRGSSTRTKDDKKAKFSLSSGQSLLAAGNHGRARWYAAKARELASDPGILRDAQSLTARIHAQEKAAARKQPAGVQQEP